MSCDLHLFVQRRSDPSDENYTEINTAHNVSHIFCGPSKYLTGFHWTNASPEPYLTGRHQTAENGQHLTRHLNVVLHFPSHFQSHEIKPVTRLHTEKVGVIINVRLMSSGEVCESSEARWDSVNLVRLFRDTCLTIFYFFTTPFGTLVWQEQS